MPDPVPPKEEPSNRTLQSQIDELDKRIVGQEHRIPHILHNLYKYKFKEKDSDKFGLSILSLISYLVARKAAVIVLSLSAGLVSLATLYLLYQQNDLIRFQNEKIIQQNQLSEAERRSSLVFLFNNIMDAIDAELTNPKPEGLRIKSDSGQYSKLSRQLIGRIIALSRRLEPYRVYDYEKDSLGSLTSPERGQLLINLLESNIDVISLSEIYDRGIFNHADIREYKKNSAFLSCANLKDANLNNVNLKKSDLTGAVLVGANLMGANLKGSNLNRVNLTRANLTGAVLTGVNLKIANLIQANLTRSSLTLLCHN